MGINFQEIANEYHTPYYVYDFDHITKQYNELKGAFKARKSLVAYAVKANSNLSVVNDFVSYRILPINVLFPSSTLPAVAIFNTCI